MSKLSNEQTKRIIKALEERGATRPCPRCGNKDFELSGGYFIQILQTELDTYKLGGPSIPSVVVVCTKCGYISQHALGILELLPEEGEG